MNREIKFRGWFQGFNGQECWVFGYLLQNGDGNWEITDGQTYWTVDNVGQYTGSKDKNGKEIYEGDIYVYEDFSQGAVISLTGKKSSQPTRMAVAEMGLTAIDQRPYGSGFDKSSEIEVIGNIHQNEDLL